VLREAGTSLTAGQPLSDPLSKSWVFPPLVVHMVTVGEQTGNLDYMLNKIADFYEAETDAMVDRLKTLIEPLMMVILTTVVGTIVIAVIQPMFSIYQQVNSIS
jgi:type IV pilus assembly protein PilC